ncbi:ABC transporter substrate-binding protein [Gordonia liuliyuniae]|uniref:ABC transporter substrate-binding protein n=1 Tax=Gordonia liuliyuniae TaxID=2911517 RepID=A0ABS9IPW2_9ACTN|nr:ABC transporter substrate-binding protein [Gordonia liuliyuniae]MCF8587593.1 ABC transporter substrate-binding protein [Gordonia liuliyuniae]
MNASIDIRRAVRSTLAVGAAAALLLGGLTACSSDDESSSAGPTTTLADDPATGDTIKIGFIAPEGGQVTVPSVREGAEAAAQYVNANGGGIGGHKLELVVCKQHEEPATATKCANEMVEKKVAAVVTPLGAQGAVMLPIISGAGIPYIAQAPVSQAEMVSPDAFMISGGIVGVLAAEAATAAKDGLKKVTVLIGDTGDAAASVKALGEPMFARAGVELKVITIPTATADPTPQIAAGLADNPDAVTILGDTRQCIQGIKALESAAPDVQKYLIASCLDQPVVEAVGEEALSGAKAFTTVNLTSDDESVTLYRSVMAEYAPDTDPQGLGYLGYQVVMAVAEVGGSLPAGGVGPEQMKAALKSATDVPVPAAPGLTFTCNGKAMPQLPSLCSKAMLVSTVGDDLKFTDTVVVNK